MSGNLLDLIKPQLEGMHEMYVIGYKAGVVEGRRQAQLEFVQDLKKLQEEIHVEATPKNQDGV